MRFIPREQNFRWCPTGKSCFFNGRGATVDGLCSLERSRNRDDVVSARKIHAIEMADVLKPILKLLETFC